MSDMKLPPSQQTLTQMSRSSNKARQIYESELNTVRKLNKHNLRLKKVESITRTRIFEESCLAEKCDLKFSGLGGGYKEMEEASDEVFDRKVKRSKKRFKRSGRDESEETESNVSPCLLGMAHPVSLSRQLLI